jgi:protoporphyrinogen oxidase
MNIAIIGAGFTGLSAAYELVKQGHSVTVFEKDAQPGGLAIGYQEKHWEWSLEKHYHHWFTNDDFVLNLAKEIDYNVLIRTPKSSFYVDGGQYKFDSPLAILSFPKLPFIDKFRMAAVFALLFRFNPFWKPLERYNVATIVPKLIGKKAYTMLWKPQLENKMGAHADKISLVWFWARIKKRTTSLAYPEGGFLHFAEALVDAIEKKGGKITFNNEVLEIKEDTQVSVTYKTSSGKQKTENYDKVIFTLPSFLFLKITPQLPEAYKKSLVRLQGLSATNMLLRLKKPFFKDNTYWLSICDMNAPIMAIIEHTNFMDKSHYANEHLVYLGNYAFTDDKLTMDKEKLLSIYDPYLQKINPDYKKNIIGYELFKAPFAQPIVPTNYSKLMPAMTTPLKNVLLANIEQVYPWDRGTNYAVELGQKAAKRILSENETR